ncbi:MAG: 16S rRNA (adenine(1518)-N(6)/adenine(1519)-N(6))-dimethyltransferase RsmA [Bacteroidales bacterium]|nr:16S rRNA (adenine(1518)-N(6)/adenine(1519)-N(6))-dimethyltransferase RsmA [Bacteroidales bacterium]
MYVKPKKALGQHFLTDLSIAQDIVDALLCTLDKVPALCADSCAGSESSSGAKRKYNVLEIGPGTGVLTQYLVQATDVKLELAEIDDESIEYLRAHYTEFLYTLQKRDFLEVPLEDIFSEPFAIIGNFPYNISSQIFFRILDYLPQVPLVVCMLQKEVAQRLASKPGNKAYGILSVLLQAWYDIEYLFTVDENVFNPPPKVKSAVIRLTRNARTSLGCNPAAFKQIVKTAFNLRRKTLRNSLKQILGTPVSKQADMSFVKEFPQTDMLNLRPEQLSVDDFIALTNLLTALQ